MNTRGNADRVLLAHGGGGQLSDLLIRRQVLPRIGWSGGPLYDAGSIEIAGKRLYVTTDSYVVKPLFFPGGDIGKLAVCGTINDLAVCGAVPLAISLALIIEEGLEMEVLEQVLDSIGRTASDSGVEVVTGDTKTVEAGSADGLFVNTTGIGLGRPGIDLGFDRILPGDTILINGTIGDHGMTILAQRQDIGFQTPIISDCSCLLGLVERLLAVAGRSIRFMRDPTRGGLAATLCEMAIGCGRSIEIREDQIPVRPPVMAACEMLGLDVLNVANEGKVVIVVDPAVAQDCLRVCREHPLGRDAAIIGIVKEQTKVPIVEMQTRAGGRRIVQMPYGAELPRIC